MLKSFVKFNEDDKRKRQRNRNRNHNRDLFNDFFTFETFHAFKELRDVFMNAFILRHFDSTLSLRVEIDVFNKTIETILCQCYEHTQKEDLRDLKDEKMSIKLKCYLITIVLFANR